MVLKVLKNLGCVMGLGERIRQFFLNILFLGLLKSFSLMIDTKHEYCSAYNSSERKAFSFVEARTSCSFSKNDVELLSQHS